MEYSPEQSLHDQINLGRLVRRLEKSTSDQEWNQPQGRAWIKAQGTLQKVKYARKLLRNAETYEPDPASKKSQQYHDMRMKLDRIELFVKEVEKQTAPKPTRPEPMLPHIPPPVKDTPGSPSNDKQDSGLSFPDPGAELPADNLLLSPSDAIPLPSVHIIPTLIPASTSSSAVTTGAAPRFLQNSSALQQELSDQLAQMATQLRRNALHFSESLAKDQAVVEETHQKLEGNFGIMTKERLRLRDLRGKSGSTTCLVVLIIFTVTLLFVLMVSIIRFT